MKNNWINKMDKNFMIRSIFESNERLKLSYPDRDFLRLVFNTNNLIIVEGFIDSVYESDNGLEEPFYEECYALLLFVNKIISNNEDITYLKNFMEIPEKKGIMSNNKIIWENVNKYIDIWYDKSPNYICIKNNKIIWENPINNNKIDIINKIL